MTPRSIFRYSIPLGLILLLFCSCRTTSLKQSQRLKAFRNLSWLEGKWERTSVDFFMAEHWVRVNDSLFTGTAVMVMQGDTILDENMSIFTSGMKVYFKTSSANRDFNINASYLLISSKKDRSDFSDPENTGQYRISYIRSKKTGIIIETEGITDGKKNIEQYSLNAATP